MACCIIVFLLLQGGQTFPQLGDRMPTTAIRTDDSLMIMAGKKSLVYQFSFYGVRYCLTSDSNGCVSFICVDDPGYILHDGFGIGDPAEKVLTLTGHTAIKEDGWAFYIPLLSGWNAAFVQGESRTEGELGAMAKVAFLFKRR